MSYKLLKDTIELIEQFELEQHKYTKDIEGFKHWIANSTIKQAAINEPNWEGKEKGRSAESVINTLIVHMNRYAKTYSKSAMIDSAFSTQEEFIYLINLRAFGAISKMSLIKKNIQDKPSGMQIINRLLHQGLIAQQHSDTDKRSKILSITTKGNIALDNQMDKIRQATQIVTGNLDHAEKMELIKLLDKLDHFHKPLFLKKIDSNDLLETAWNEIKTNKN